MSEHDAQGARDCFDAALDDELSADARATFEAALAADPALRAEFARHREVVEATRALGRALPPVDLLAGVQDKLRARSGGKFYRDRFAAARGQRVLGWMLGACATLVLLVGLWLAYDAGWIAR
ncbi:MAG: hypothetical protein ABW252_24245 [Polyangiales bacterium]